MGEVKILLVPDAYFGNQSGAIVTQIAKKLLLENGNEVSIFSCDIAEDGVEKDDIKLYHRTAYHAYGNWKESQYVREYEKVLDHSEASLVFTLGSITNKNLCYLEIAKQRGLKVTSWIFMQDFFCVKYYANDSLGPCTKCLDNNYFEAFKNKCIIKEPIDYFKTANALLIRKRLGKILPEIDYVITSTDEQIGFYQKFGIPNGKCIKTPLYFNVEKIEKLQSSLSMGDYYACIAQNRVEKGFHFLPAILDHCDASIKIIAVYSYEEQARKAIKLYGFQRYLEKGILEVKFDMSWGSGLEEILAKSRGIIIPTIWPSTTEFGLIEALGLGKPVFTFDISIHHEMIINGVNGFKAPLNDCKTIANQLMKLRNDDELYKIVSAGARQLYYKMTDWNVWKDTLKSIGM